LSQTCINEKEIEIVFYNKMEELISFFQRREHRDKIDLKNIYVLLIICIQFNNPQWIHKIRELTEMTNDDSDSDIILLKEIINLMSQKPRDNKFRLKDLLSDINDCHLRFILTNLKCVSL
jgi:hypothetical protein